MDPPGAVIMSSSTAVTLFVSYAHEDEDLREELVKHLKLLQRQGVIEDWYDRLIRAGQEWDQEIQTRLLTSNIILLLVSADFLASDYCWDKEVQQAMERHHNGDAVVIPIILRACDWNSAPFGKIQALPRDARPVMSWSDRDEALLDIARGIRQVAFGIQARVAQEQRKNEEIQKLRSRLPELMDRDHLHQARDTLRELERLGWKGADLEDWRERIDEAILREEKTGDLLDFAIKASEGEHYDEALKYLEEAASISPDHSGIQRLRTAVENRQQKLTFRAANRLKRTPEERPPEKRGLTFPREEGQTTPLADHSQSQSSSPVSLTSEDDAARLAERGSEPSTMAGRALAQFRTRPRMQMTGGVLIVFLAVLLFYRVGPAIGDQNSVDQEIAELQGEESGMVLEASSTDERQNAVDGPVQQVRPPPEEESFIGPPTPPSQTRVPPTAGRQEASSGTSGQPAGGSNSAAVEIPDSAPSGPPPTTTPDRTPVPASSSESVSDRASESPAQTVSQPDPLAAGWLKTGFDGLQTESRQQIGRSLREILVSQPNNGRANLYLAMIYLAEDRAEQARDRLLAALSADLTLQEAGVARQHFLQLPHRYPVEHLHPSLSARESGCTGILSFNSDLVSFQPSSGDEEQITVKVPAVRRAEFEQGTLQIHLQGGRPLTFKFGQGQDIRDVHAVLVHGYGFSGQ